MPNRNPREDYEESLRTPEPPSNMARIATVVWIGLTVVVMGAAVYFVKSPRLPRILLAIAGGSASLYAIAAHQNRLGDRSID